MKQSIKLTLSGMTFCFVLGTLIATGSVIPALFVLGACLAFRALCEALS